MTLRNRLDRTRLREPAPKSDELCVFYWGFRRLLQLWGFGDGFAVFAGVGSAVIYASRKVAAHSLASADLLSEIAEKFDLMAALC